MTCSAHGIVVVWARSKSLTRMFLTISKQHPRGRAKEISRKKIQVPCLSIAVAWKPCPCLPWALDPRESKLLRPPSSTANLPAHLRPQRLLPRKRANRLVGWTGKRRSSKRRARLLWVAWQCSTCHEARDASSSCFLLGEILFKPIQAPTYILASGCSFG